MRIFAFCLLFLCSNVFAQLDISACNLGIYKRSKDYLAYEVVQSLADSLYPAYIARNPQLCSMNFPDLQLPQNKIYSNGTWAGNIQYIYPGGYIRNNHPACMTECSYCHAGWRELNACLVDSCPAGYEDAGGRCVKYAAALLDSLPPPTCTAGNPIDTSNGTKIQKEIDIESGGFGQVDFERTYKHVNSNSAGKWIQGYQKSLNVVEDELVGGVREKSSLYSSRASACTSGWLEIQSRLNDEAWAQNASANWNVQKKSCEIIKNNEVVSEILVLPEPSIIRMYIPGYVQLIREDGARLDFHQTATENVFVNRGSNNGVLKRVVASVVTWEFKNAKDELEIYDAKGRLISITSSNGMKQELIYDATSGLLTRVKDSTNRELLFSYVDRKISSVTADGNKKTSYTYNAAGLITQVTRPDNTTRIYHYEDTRFPTALTGITDERNKRYATWAYDAQGRAISSEHAGGAEKTLLSFNADGSTTVTNSLNKQTIYRFARIAGARRVVKVEGQPTTNCVGANQDYTYTAEGWLASKTDWKGIKTTYQYNTLGQETSRTEAFDTTEARTITTEWHPSLYVKTKVTEPGKETVFNYDANGRLLNQSTTALSN